MVLSFLTDYIDHVTQPPPVLIHKNTRPNYTISPYTRYGSIQYGDLHLVPSSDGVTMDKYSGEGNLVVGKDVLVKGTIYADGGDVLDRIRELEQKIKSLEEKLADENRS